MSVSERVMYLRPPKPARPKKAVAKPPHKEVSDFLFHYRVQLIPFLVSLIVLTIGVLFGPVMQSRIPVGTLGTTSVALALTWFMFQDQISVPVRVPWFRLDRPVERWYAAACTGTAALWFLGATWGGTKPGPRAIAVLLILTALWAAPWWHHRRVRGSIPVRFHGLTAARRKKSLEQARLLVQDWNVFASAGHAQGARLQSITYNRWSVIIRVVLRRGATVGEFTARRLEKLESAFAGTSGDIHAGSCRVERVNKSARLADFRFMIEDPHADPIFPPEDVNTSMERIKIGLFETGEEVFFQLVNTLVGGTTGAGKSGVISIVIRALCRIPNVAMVGIDLKPGAPELGKWESVMHKVAKTPEETRILLDQLYAGFEYRGQIMSANGWRKWRVTRFQPFIVLIIDEIQELKRAGLMKKVDDVAAIIRAYGGCLVVATQYPTKPNVSSTIKANCSQRIGLRNEDDVADRVIFGSQATRMGWRSSVLIPSDRQGSFLIKSPRYKRPLLARGFWMEDDDITQEALTWAPQRTQIDREFWDAVNGASRLEVTSGPPVVVLDKAAEDDQPVNTVEIVDAVIVDDDPLERVLQALERGRRRPVDVAADAGMSRPTVYKYLGILKEQELASNPRRGEWESTRIIEEKAS